MQGNKAGKPTSFFPNIKLDLFETLRTNFQQHENLKLLNAYGGGNLGFAVVTLKKQAINRLPFSIQFLLCNL